MKTPITYYGGKQTMLKHILPLIPGAFRLYGSLLRWCGRPVCKRAGSM